VLDAQNYVAYVCVLCVVRTCGVYGFSHECICGWVVHVRETYVCACTRASLGERDIA